MDPDSSPAGRPVVFERDAPDPDAGGSGGGAVVERDRHVSSPVASGYVRKPVSLKSHGHQVRGAEKFAARATARSGCLPVRLFEAAVKFLADVFQQPAELSIFTGPRLPHPRRVLAGLRGCPVVAAEVVLCCPVEGGDPVAVPGDRHVGGDRECAGDNAPYRFKQVIRAAERVPGDSIHAAPGAVIDCGGHVTFPPAPFAEHPHVPVVQRGELRDKRLVAAAARVLRGGRAVGVGTGIAHGTVLPNLLQLSGFGGREPSSVSSCQGVDLCGS